MPRPANKSPNPFIPATQVARIVGCSVEWVPKVAAAGRVRIQQIPGMPKRYNRDDVIALAARSVRVAGEDEGSTAVEASPKMSAAAQ